MNAPARPPKAGEPAAFAITERSYYLINDERSAAIEEYGLALLALSEIACDDVNGEDGDVSISRLNLKCLFVTLERSFTKLVGPDALPHAFLPEAVFAKGHRE